MRIWVLSTCIPDENEPCLPSVFATEVEAEAEFTRIMRGEWDSFTDWNGDDGPTKWPGDPRLAQDIMAKASPTWGRWEITEHNIEASEVTEAIESAREFERDAKAPRTTFIPVNDHGVKPGYYTIPDIVRLLRKHHANPKAVHFIADMME